MDKGTKFRLSLVIALWFIIFIGLYSFFSPNLPDLNFSSECRAIDYNSLKCDRSSDRAKVNKITEERLTHVARISSALERISKFDPE